MCINKYFILRRILSDGKHLEFTFSEFKVAALENEVILKGIYKCR